MSEPIREVIRIHRPAENAVEVEVTRWPGPEGADTFVVLHGGAGPSSMLPLCRSLSLAESPDVIAVTHPGFDGTVRPEGLRGVSALADVYATLLDQLELRDVILVGNSFGGWIASEVALANPDRVSILVLIDATGIVVDGHPVADPEQLGLDEIIARSFHDPARFRVDPTGLPPQAAAVQAGNMSALAAYMGPDGGDRSLIARLRRLPATTLVLHGESDRIIDLPYATAYADAVGASRLQVLPATGHVPQLETPELVASAVLDFARTVRGERRTP